MAITTDKTITKKKNKKDDDDSTTVEKKKMKKDKKKNKLMKKEREQIGNKQEKDISSSEEQEQQQQHINSSISSSLQEQQEDEESYNMKIDDSKKKRKYSDVTTTTNVVDTSRDNERRMKDDDNHDDDSKRHKKDKKKKNNKKEKKEKKTNKKKSSKTKQYDSFDDTVDMNIDISTKKNSNNHNIDNNNNQNDSTTTTTTTITTTTTTTILPKPIPLSTLLSKSSFVSSKSTVMDTTYPLEHGARLLVESDASSGSAANDDQNNTVSLVLFYQYVEPTWTTTEYETVLQDMTTIGNHFNITGRMRIAKEGLNCTLSADNKSIMYSFINLLRLWKPSIFYTTEFKLTNNLPYKQKFSSLKVLKVIELVHYGLDGYKAPSLKNYSGIHLEPKQYHSKLQESDIIVIDVRNHYETRIGHFNPPISSSSSTKILTSTTTTKPNTAKDNKEEESDDMNGRTIKTDKKVQQQQQEEEEQEEQIISTKYIDPKIRKSTEFPLWLSLDSTKQLLHNKQVLMYCTGGIRCERASSLLQYKLHNDPSMTNINVKGIYQLQGGIDKYFNEYPNGDYWIGKNYVFDKRFTHTPSLVNNNNTTTETNTNKDNHNDDSNDDGDNDSDSEDEKKEKKDTTNKDVDVINKKTLSTNTSSAITTTISTSKCEICAKQWDMYRGKYRCSTCGVPSLICKECIMNDKNNIKKINKKSIRCDLCVEQNIYSKYKLLSTIQNNIEQYEQQSLANNTLYPGKQQQSQQQSQQPSQSDEIEQEEYNDDVYNTNKKHIREKNNNNNHNDHTSNSKKRQKQQQQQQQQQERNTNNIQKSTRLRISNLFTDITEELLCEYITGITHIVWKMDHTNNMFLGVAWIEIDTIDNAIYAVTNQYDIIKKLVISNNSNNSTSIINTDNNNNNNNNSNNYNNTKKKNFPIRIQYDPPDSKDIWPPPNSAIYL